MGAAAAEGNDDHSDDWRQSCSTLVSFPQDEKVQSNILGKLESARSEAPLPFFNRRGLCL